MATAEIPRKIWTREEAHTLVDLGVPNAEKLELINGELINRMGKKQLHIYWQTVIHEWLLSVFGPGLVVSEGPIDLRGCLGELNEPEPDLKLLRTRIAPDQPVPSPEDILLVIEISDSTVQFDLTVKAELYARAGIEEYWVVNIPDQMLIVHRKPRNGRYDSVVRLLSNEEIAPLAAPQALFSLNRV